MMILTDVPFIGRQFAFSGHFFLLNDYQTGSRFIYLQG